MNAANPLIIECRCNETAYRDGNPNLPYSPDEIVREAVRAWEAGASVFHWHGRNPHTGEPQNDVELYLDVITGVREQTDLLIHPTLGYISQEDVGERVKHVLAVNGDPRLKVELAPVDFGSLNVDFWNPQTKRFETTDRVYKNSRANLENVLEVFKANDVFVTAVCWDLGQVRTARCFQEMGLLQRAPLWEFVFSGETMPSGTPSEPHALQALVAAIPAGEPWLVLSWNGDVLPVAAWAITLGGHVAIGLGDAPYKRFGTPHNGGLVRKVVDLAHLLGREVATPAQARDVLGLRARPDLPSRSAP